MLNITYNSCYYLFTLKPEKFRCYFRRVVSLRRKANWSRHWARSMYFFRYFSEFSFSSWISWFQNLEIYPPFLRNSCDEITWWIWVTIVNVIFTCWYFKLSQNTSSLSQSNGRNFSSSSITVKACLINLKVLSFYYTASRLSLIHIWRCRRS